MYRDNFIFPVLYVEVSLKVFRLYPHLLNNPTFTYADTIYQDSLTKIKTEYSKISTDPQVISTFGKEMSDLIVLLDQINTLLNDLKSNLVSSDKFSVDYRPLRDNSIGLIDAIILQL